MAGREGQFLADMKFLANYQTNLSKVAYFVAGMCRAKSDSSLKHIVKTLCEVEKAAEDGRISLSHRKLMLNYAYKGRHEELRKTLDRVSGERRWAEAVDRKVESKLVTCKICLEEGEESVLEPLSHCGHSFHTACLQSHFENAIASAHIPVKCPEATCSTEVSPLDIRALVTKRDFLKYENFTVNYFVQQNPGRIRTCPTANCQFVFEFQGETDFRCVSCRKRYCLKCMTDYHRGMTCEEFRQSRDQEHLDQEFHKFVGGRNFKQCVNCRFWVEKTSGCNHMICKCGLHFCYRCGCEYSACACR